MNINFVFNLERLKREEEQRLKEEVERLAARKLKLEESLTSKKHKSKSALFDSGEEDENGEGVTEVTDEVAEVTGSERKETRLQEAVDELDENVLDQIVGNLNSQLSKLTKKDSFFYKVLEHAIENVQETVTEAKQKVKDKKKSIEERPSNSEGTEVKPALSEQSLSREVQTKEDNDKEQEGLPPDGSTVTDKAATNEEEEEDESSQTLEGLFRTLLEKNTAALAKRLKGDELPSEGEGAKLVKEDLEVEVKEDEDEEIDLDEASLTELGDELTGELQKKLSDAGLGDEGKVPDLSRGILL